MGETVGETPVEAQAQAQAAEVGHEIAPLPPLASSDGRLDGS